MTSNAGRSMVISDANKYILPDTYDNGKTNRATPFSSQHELKGLFVWQFAGDDAGVISVRPEGCPGSVSAFLSESGATASAAAGLPVC